MAREPVKFTFDGESGEIVLENGSRYGFLPATPSQSPPYEFLIPESDPEAADGATHLLIGGDPGLVDKIVAFYAAKGTPVPAGYAEEAARHVAAVAEEAARGAGA